MRPTRDQWAMEMACVTAKRSTCLRRNVGCVILNNRGHVLSTGYNGVAAGLPHCNDETGFNFVYNNRIDETKPLTGQSTDEKPVYGHACDGAYSPSGTNLDACQAIHAEQNALLQCRDVYNIHSIFVTTAPCITCTKLLLNTSCQRIVFLEDYPHVEAAKALWETAGREWIKYLT